MDTTKRRPLFIFGSGTSPAPNVKELTTFVIDARLYRGEDGMYYLADENDQPRPGEEAARWYLRRIQQDIATYQKQPLAKVTYEDVANVCVQLDKETGSRRNPALWPYRENLRQQLHAHFSDADPGEVASDAIDQIKWGVRLALSQCAEQPDALGRFSRAIIEPLVSATIVTLNHDLYLDTDTRSSCQPRFSVRRFRRRVFQPGRFARRLWFSASEAAWLDRLVLAR